MKFQRRFFKMKIKMKIPETLFRLAQRNEQTVISLCLQLGCEVNDLKEDWALCKKAGLLFMGNFLKESRYKMFLTSSLHEKGNPFISLQKRKLAECLLVKGCTLIIIRPDLYHSSQEIVCFLRQQSFRVVGVFDLLVNSDTYWNMYKSSIVHPHAWDTMPTRTMAYTGSSVKIVVFQDKNLNGSSESLFADVFSARYKGQQGVRRQGTLRGDLVFSEATRLGFHVLDDFAIQMACDPLGAYRHKIAGNCVSKTIPHGHLQREYQLLQYTGVGVHVPDGTEFVNDTCSLLSLEQIESLVDPIYS